MGLVKQASPLKTQNQSQHHCTEQMARIQRTSFPELSDSYSPAAVGYKKTAVWVCEVDMEVRCTAEELKVTTCDQVFPWIAADFTSCISLHLRVVLCLSNRYTSGLCSEALKKDLQKPIRYYTQWFVFINRSYN